MVPTTGTSTTVQSLRRVRSPVPTDEIDENKRTNSVLPHPKVSMSQLDTNSQGKEINESTNDPQRTIRHHHGQHGRGSTVRQLDRDLRDLEQEVSKWGLQRGLPKGLSRSMNNGWSISTRAAATKGAGVDNDDGQTSNGLEKNDLSFKYPMHLLKPKGESSGFPTDMLNAPNQSLEKTEAAENSLSKT